MNASWCASPCPWARGCESGAPSFPTRSQVPSSGTLRRRPEDQRLETLCSIVLAMRQQVGGRLVSAARGAGGERAGRAFAKLKGLQAGFCSRGSCSLLTGMLEIAYCTVTAAFSKLLCVQRRTLRTFKFVEGVSCQGPSGPGTRQLPPSHTPRSLNCAYRVTTLGW